jgi:RND superfamily putative drug exporter
VDGFFPRLGAAVAKHHWLVIGLWLALFVAAIPGVKNVKDSLVSGGFELADSDSGRGAKVLEQEFGRRTVTTGVVVFASDRLTLDDPVYGDAVKKSLDRVRQVDGVKEIFSFFSTGNPRFVAGDKKTTYAVVNFVDDEEEAKKLTPKVREQLADQPGDVRAHLMGFPAVSYDLSAGSADDLKHAELTSLPLTLLLLLLVFGTILAAGLPLILGAAAVVISLAGIYLYAQRVETSIFAMNTASMIGLGLGIDFSLLMVSRFREELAKGISSTQATINTVATSGRSIVFSGLTVMLGLSVLCLYDLVLIRSIAVGMLLVAGVAMLGAVTLLPALLALFGAKLNAWRLIPNRKRGGRQQAARAESEGRWHRWSMMVMRRPWLFMIATVALLLLLAAPARELNAIGSGGHRGMAPHTDTRQGFDTLLAAFGAGEATPVGVVVRAPNDDGAFEPRTLEGVHRLVREIEKDPRVQRVESLVQLLPPQTTEAQFKSLNEQALMSNPQLAPFVPTFVNVRRPTDTADRPADVQIISVFSKYDELDEETIHLVQDLRGTIVPGVSALRGLDVNVTGQTALILDYRDRLFGQLPMLIGLVLLVTYLVLLLFFHSLILPLKAILLNVVAILASYGVLVMVFQHGVGENLLDFDHLGRLSMFSPVILFSILFGLSTDYEVFLLSRVKEIYEHTKDNDLSVALGLERTAGIITAAGLIMIVVFGSFALGDTLVIKELGVGLAVAVLIDSTIIRVILVPASMKLMGDLNWWMPKFLDWIPQIKESVELPAAAPVYAQARGPVANGHGLRPCPVCRTPLRPTARFCGRCGSALGAPVAAPVGAAVDHGQTMADWRLAGVPVAGPGGQTGAPGSASGARRIPVILSNGRQQQRAWLVLRDCHVDDNQQRGSVPLLQIDGLDLAPLSGQEPEIQIRNARVRM